MDKTLYLFVTSENPDTYLNPVVHCVLEEEVGKIIFLRIVGYKDNKDGAPKSLGNGIASTISHQVEFLLKRLAGGEYGHSDSDKLNLESIYAADKMTLLKDRYRSVLRKNLRWGSNDIEYKDIPKELAKFKREGGSVILDVTAIGKKLIGDLVLAAIRERIDNLSTFDLIRPPNYDKEQRWPNYDEPWSILYHDLVDLESGKKLYYEYVNILRTTISESCLKRIWIRPSSSQVWAALLAALSLLLIIVAFNSDERLVTRIASFASIFSFIWSAILAWLTFRRRSE